MLRDNDYSLDPRRESIDLTELTRQVMQPQNYTDKYCRPVRITIQSKCTDRNAWANRQQLTQVLQNLHQDASIHPNARGPIKLSVRIWDAGTDTIRLRITSLGAEPIPPEIARKIGYEKFSTRQGEEHGLGKISVKRIIEANGGSFRAFNYRNRPALEIRLTHP